MNIATIKSLISKLQGLTKYFPPPLREVLSEPDGTGSYSRVSGMLIVIATIGWVSYLVIHNHALPDLTGPAAFVAAGQAQYAVNKLTSRKTPSGDSNATQS